MQYEFQSEFPDKSGCGRIRAEEELPRGKNFRVTKSVGKGASFVFDYYCKIRYPYTAITRTVGGENLSKRDFSGEK